MPSSGRPFAPEARTARGCCRGAVIAAAGFWSTPAVARDAPVCARVQGAVEYRVELNQGRVVNDLSLSKDDLTARFSRFHAKGEGARMMTGGWSTVGLTESNLEIIISTRTEVRPARGGGVCANLSEVTLTVGYPELRVFIPREYDVGSCPYDVVREHEMEHVAITRAVLEDHAPRLDAALARAVADINPLWAGTKDEARGIAARAIREALEPVVQAMTAEHRRRNQVIDATENYVSLQSRCDTW